MKTCPFCGAQLADDARFCLACAHSLNEKRIIPKAHRLSTRLLIRLTAVFLMLVFSLSVFALLLYPPQAQPSDSTVQRPSHTASSSYSELFSAESSQFSDLSEASSSSSHSGSSSQSSSAWSSSSQSSSKPSSSSQSSSKSSSSSSIPIIGGKVFPITPPAGFQAYPIYVTSVDYYIQQYHATGNQPELLTNAGLRKNENVIMTGVNELTSDHCYYVPEKVGDYTVVALGYYATGAPKHIFMGGDLTIHMKKIYTPPSCRFFLGAFSWCEKLTDIYIAADSFYLSPYELPYLNYYAPGNIVTDSTRRTLTIHAQPDAWLEHAGMTVAEYMSDPDNAYKCDFEPWDPSTVY